MEDKGIVELFWARSEHAIRETDIKYGNYLKQISRNILTSQEDAQECVNDTYLDAWNIMPPHRPSVLSTFLGKITRRISIDRWRRNHADKRGGGELPIALEELEGCVSGSESVENAAVYRELVRVINEFLDSLPVTERRVFLLRYWYMEPIHSISQRFGFSRSKTTSMLHRTRGKLRERLEKEGW